MSPSLLNVLICVCVPASVRLLISPGEADELSHRLQSTKQRMAELERTLSSVSTQQKQFEKVTLSPTQSQ